MGRHRAVIDLRPLRAGGPRVARHGRSAAVAGFGAHLARLRLPALLRPAHHASHVPGAGGLARLHADLCHAGGEEPAGRNRADPAARRAAVGADPGLPVLHRDVLPEPVPGLGAGGGTRRHLRHLHEPGLEHGLLVLPVAAHRAGRPRRGLRRVSAVVLAKVLAARDALRHAVAHLQHDDVDVGRVVLRRGGRGHHGGRHDHQAAGHRLLSRHRHRRQGHQGGAGRRRHGAGGDPALRPADVPPHRHLGRQVQGGAVGLAGDVEVLGAEPARPYLLGAPRRGPAQKAPSNGSRACASTCRASGAAGTARPRCRGPSTSPGSW